MQREERLLRPPSSAPVSLTSRYYRESFLITWPSLSRTKDTWDPERVLRIAKKISNSSSIIQTNINVLRDITPVYQDDCSQKSNDSVNYGCYMLKLPIPDIRHKSLMCGERAGTSFVGRMQAMIHPEQPAPGTLAYHFCMANCPGIGGTGFSWIPLQIVGVEVSPLQFN